MTQCEWEQKCQKKASWLFIFKNGSGTILNRPICDSHKQDEKNCLNAIKWKFTLKELPEKVNFT